MNYQDYVDDLDELYEQAEAVLAGFRVKIESISSSTRGKAIGAPLKGRTRARSKAQFKYSDERGEIAWYRLTDVVRATISVKTLHLMYHCLRAIVEDCELEVVEYNDRYMRPMAVGSRPAAAVAVGGK